MKAVMSLWTQAAKFQLTRNDAILFSAASAYCQAAYPDNELVTDIQGLRIADRLGWDFTSFTLALQDFCPPDQKKIWALGKVKAASIQSSPFFHLDLDFLLFSKFNARIESAVVAVQSKDEPEFYFSPKAQAALREAEIPPWTCGYNASLFLWNDLSLRDTYVARSLKVAAKIANFSNNGTLLSIIAEQAVLGAVLRDARIKPECIIPLATQCQPEDFDTPWCHCWGRAKQRPEVIARVEKRFAADFPLKYKQAIHGFELIQRFGLGSITKSYGY